RHLSTSYFHLFIHSSARHRHLHSFPTRRSSDLAEYDRKLTVHMIRYARDLLRQPLLREYLGEEIFPGHSCLSEEEIINVCRQFGAGACNYAGTCRMGQDSMAVVDPMLRVRGVSGLRVVDCSIMPTLVSGNTNGPVMA